MRLPTLNQPEHMPVKPRHERRYGFEKSLWYATAGAGPTCPKLESDQSADIVIVGAGYTGLSSAYQLARRGVDVAILEAGEPGWGASGRNNGGIVPDFAFATADKVSSAHDADQAKRIIDLVDRSAEMLETLVEGIGGECDLRLEGFLDLVHDPERTDFLRARYDSLESRGHSVRWLSGEESTTLSGSPEYSHGGYLLDRSGHVHPLKLARALAKAIISEGGRIFSHSPALGIERDGSGWRVRSERGSIRAGQVLLAQNAYADGLWPGTRKASLHIQPWLVATQRLPDNVYASIIPGDQLIGDSHPGPYFFRKTADGRLSIAVMKGISLTGGVPKFSPTAEVVSKVFPQIGPVDFEYAWQGLATLQPGELPKLAKLDDGIWAAYGFGRGVTMANAMGTVVADVLTGDEKTQSALPVSELESIRMGGLIDRLIPLGMTLANRKG
jgi:glycine/D-amino acid oxidase-like deaminating enzyme